MAKKSHSNHLHIPDWSRTEIRIKWIENQTKWKYRGSSKLRWIVSPLFVYWLKKRADEFWSICFIEFIILCISISFLKIHIKKTCSQIFYLLLQCILCNELFIGETIHLSCAIHRRCDLFSQNFESSLSIGGNMVMDIQHSLEFSYAGLNS